MAGARRPAHHEPVPFGLAFQKNRAEAGRQRPKELAVHFGLRLDGPLPIWLARHLNSPVQKWRDGKRTVQRG